MNEIMEFLTEYLNVLTEENLLKNAERFPNYFLIKNKNDTLFQLIIFQR